jgi:hypothetical protein
MNNSWEFGGVIRAALRFSTGADMMINNGDKELGIRPCGDMRTVEDMLTMGIMMECIGTVRMYK